MVDVGDLGGQNPIHLWVLEINVAKNGPRGFHSRRKARVRVRRVVSRRTRSFEFPRLRGSGLSNWGSGLQNLHRGFDSRRRLSTSKSRDSKTARHGSWRPSSCVWSRCLPNRWIEARVCRTKARVCAARVFASARWFDLGKARDWTAWP